MPDRITLSRTKGSRKPAGAVVVARPLIWGNPWIAGDPGRVLLPGPDGVTWQAECDLSLRLPPEGAVELFRSWLSGVPATLPACLNAAGDANYTANFAHRRSLVLTRLPTLRGKDLACWCKPGSPCHATVLMEFANA